jgi:biopolymer transport protein ExbB
MWPRAIGKRFFATCLAAICLWAAAATDVSPLATRAAGAQDEPPAAEEAAPAAPAAAADPAASGEDPELTKRRQESLLAWMIRSSGIFGFLIMIISFIMVALIVMIALQLRRDNYVPAALVEEFEQKLNAKDYQGAFETAKGSDSFIGRLLAAGMGRLRDGYEAAQSGMQEVGDDETMAMEQKVGYLSLIGSIAPMLGLLGTVQGMVMSFQIIAKSATSPKPYQLADGIATALFTTLEGLVVVIPAIFFFTLYKNRLARFLMEAGYIVDNLMGRFQGMGKPAATPARAGGAPAASPAAPQP